MRKFLISSVLLLIQISTSYSQIFHEDISQIQAAFQQLDYKTAKIKSEAVLQSWQQYGVTELLEVHKILGIITYSEGNLTESQSQFEQALSLYQSTELDSVYVSPKIISFFNQLKVNFNQQAKTPPSVKVRYIVVPDPRPKAILRSFVLPGWGQLYKGQQKKGVVLLTAAGVSALSWVTFYILQKNAHAKYLDASNPDEIEKKYQDYNLLYKSQHTCAYITGALWLYSLTDALISQPAPPGKISFYPGINNKGLYLMAVWCF